MNMKLAFSLILLVFVNACSSYTSQSDTEDPQDETPPQISILDLMINQVVPLTNTLWAIDEPQSDEDWNAFLSVADDAISAFEQTRRGGSGPKDAEWAADPRWTDYSNQAIAASEQFKEAINAQDMEAIWTAGDAMLAPCTTCHQDFNPAVNQ
jgi:hypothetical protein